MDDYTEQERELLNDKRDLKRTTREQENVHQEQVKALRLVKINYLKNYTILIKVKCE